MKFQEIAVGDVIIREIAGHYMPLIGADEFLHHSRQTLAVKQHD